MKSACFHPAYIRKLCLMLGNAGHDVPKILKGARLTWEELQVRESFLSFDQGRVVILATQNLLGQPKLALELGTATQMSDHGALGLAMSTSANLRAALQAFVHFAPLRTSLVQDELRWSPKGVWLIEQPKFELGDIKAFLLDRRVGLLYSLMIQITQKRLDQVTLELPWAPSPWRAVYQDMFGTVRFRAHRLALWIPTELLMHPNPSASARDHQDALRLCESQLAELQTSETIADRVRKILLDVHNDWTDQSQVATQLGLSVRTLVRHLSQEGTSFREVSEEVRRRRAAWQLRNTGLPIGDISTMLGYSVESNFCRSFKKWYGLTPTDFRSAPAEQIRELLAR